MEDYLIFNSGEIIEADFAQFWRRIHSGRGIFHDELVGRVSLTLTEVTDQMRFPASPMLTRYLKCTIGKTPSEYCMGKA